MPDTIDFVAEDEVQPEEIDFQEEVSPVVRIVPPGSLNPDDLLPAVRKIGGALAVGEPGDTHPDIIKRDKIPATDIDQRGFAGPQGEFYDRESAAQGTQLPTEMEPGRLHSTDLIKKPSEVGKLLIPSTGELSTTYGGPPKALASVAETMVEPVEALTTPRFTTPKFKIKEEDSAVLTAGKEAANIISSVPEFLSSNLGLMSVISGGVAPTATAAAFTLDMLNSLGNQVVGTYKDWDKMTRNQKVAALTDIAGTGVMAALAAHGTARGIRKQVSPLRQEVPPAVQPREAPPTAPVEVTAKPVEVATPATVEPAITEAKPEITNPQSIASNLGLRYRGTMRGVDQYVFDEPDVKTGAPSGITVSVPSGTGEAGVAAKLASRRSEYAEPAKATEPEPSVVSELGLKFDGTQPGAAIKPPTPEQLSKMSPAEKKMYADIAAQQGDQWAFTPQPGSAIPGRTFYVKAGASAEEIRAAYERKVAQEAETKAAAPVGLPEPKEGTVRVFSGGRGSSWYTTNIKRAGDFAKRNAGVLNWVDVPKDVFDAASVAAREAGSFTEGDALLPNEWVKKSADLRETLLKQSKEKPTASVVPKPVEPVPVVPVKPIQKIPPKYRSAIAREIVRGNLSEQYLESPVIELARTTVLRGGGESTSYHPYGTIRVNGKQIWRGTSYLIERKLKELFPKGLIPAGKVGRNQLFVETIPEPELVAMGAAREGEKPTTSQIEQLAQSMRGVQESKAPLGQQIREAFNIGQRFATTKSAIGQAVSGLKTAGDLLIDKWKGVEKIDDLLRAKGRLSQQIEARGWRLRQWERAAQKAIPSARDQAAIAKWVDAGGDRATLEKGLAESPARFKQAYADALALKGDKLTAAQNVQNYFESRLQEAIDAGVLDHGVENYIHRMYESKPDLLKRALAYTQTGLLKTSPSLAKKRVFQFDWEAEKEGYVPVQSFIKRITAYEASLSKAIAAREFIKKASELKAADGRPIIDIKGVGIPIEDPAGVYQEATLIKPKYNPTKNNEPLLPTGAPNPNYRGDYANRDYRALSRWKWVGSDAGGKPIFVQGDVAIHPDYVGKIDVLLQPSQVRYGRYGKILRPALGVSSVMKQTMLDLSGFHYVQITVHGMEHRVFPWNIIKDIDLADPNVDGLLRGGVSLGGDYGGAFREGLVGSSLTRLIPGLGNAVESYHQWLFQDYIPRIKMTMALHALERNRARFGDRMSEEEIFRKTANQANAAFGELNYIMLERSKTAQDISRLILLAPDFLEARARFALQAFEKGGKRFGNEQRMALLFGALTMWITARIANKIVDGQYHNEPENLFNIVYDGHAYGLRTVQGDILHFLTKPIQFWTSRLNPVYGRTTLEALTGRDYFGRKRSFTEQAWDAVSTVIPISLRSNRERKLWESLLNGFGVTARRWSDVDDAFTLAKKWKETHGVTERGEFIYDPQKDVLRPLKLALNHGDEAGAAKEIKALIDSKAYTISRLNSYFDRYSNMPFAGSFANDKKFKATLTDDQKKTVEAARQHKIEIKKLYQKSRAQYLARPVRDVEAPEVKIDFVETK